MSFVMLRIFAQLSSKDSVAAGPPCTIIFTKQALVYDYDPSRTELD